MLEKTTGICCLRWVKNRVLWVCSRQESVEFAFIPKCHPMFQMYMYAFAPTSDGRNWTEQLRHCWTLGKTFILIWSSENTCFPQSCIHHWRKFANPVKSRTNLHIAVLLRCLFSSKKCRVYAFLISVLHPEVFKRLLNWKFFPSGWSFLWKHKSVESRMSWPRMLLACISIKTKDPRTVGFGTNYPKYNPLLTKGGIHLIVIFVSHCSEGCAQIPAVPKEEFFHFLHKEDFCNKKWIFPHCCTPSESIVK